MTTTKRKSNTSLGPTATKDPNRQGTVSVQNSAAVALLACLLIPKLLRRFGANVLMDF